jgi:hypothetical protein
MLLTPESLPSGAAVGGRGVQEGSKDPWDGDTTRALQSAEVLVARLCELVRTKGGLFVAYRCVH